MAISSRELLSAAWEALDKTKSENGTFQDFLCRFEVLSQDIILTPSQASHYTGLTTRTLLNYTERGILNKVTRSGASGYSLHQLARLKWK